MLLTPDENDTHPHGPVPTKDLLDGAHANLKNAAGFVNAVMAASLGKPATVDMMNMIMIYSNAVQAAALAKIAAALELPEQWEKH